MRDPERQREVERWLRYAREDLEAARLIVEHGSVPRAACFHAQQSAEKAIKAALIFSEKEVPYRHDLDFLKNLLPGGWELKESQADLSRLTLWAIQPRYPDDLPEATEADARTAIEQAQEIYGTALEDLERHGYAPESTT
jgi:HEPN domain-containing protein